jgi:hypothetical protein
MERPDELCVEQKIFFSFVPASCQLRVSVHMLSYTPGCLLAAGRHLLRRRAAFEGTAGQDW